MKQDYFHIFNHQNLDEANQHIQDSPLFIKESFIQEVPGSSKLKFVDIAIIPLPILTLFFVFFTFSLISIVFKRNFLSGIWQHFVSIFTFKRLDVMKEKLNLFQISVMILQFICAMIISLFFIYPLLHWVELIPKAFILLSMWICLRVLSIFFVGTILHLGADFSIQLKYFVNMIILLGLLMMGLEFLFLYMDLSYIGLGQVSKKISFNLLFFIGFLVYVYGTWQQTRYFKKSYPLTYFHIFLYLCTLEVLPLIWVGKYLLKHNFI